MTTTLDNQTGTGSSNYPYGTGPATPWTVPPVQHIEPARPSGVFKIVAAVAVFALVAASIAIGFLLLQGRNQPVSVKTPATSAPGNTSALVLPASPSANPLANAALPAVPSQAAPAPVVTPPAAAPVVPPQPVTAAQPVTPTTWPASFAPFSDLIGTGPGSTATWNNATCASQTSANSEITAEVRCVETNGVVLLVEQFGAGDVAQLVTDYQADTDSTVEPWHEDGGDLGELITTKASGGDGIIMTTFNNYPNVVVALVNSGDLPALNTAWLDAPLPG